ncbi:MAG: hypothetical protein AAF555_11035 [Verrucomicrobiota bacterium]
MKLSRSLLALALALLATTHAVEMELTNKAGVTIRADVREVSDHQVTLLFNGRQTVLELDALDAASQKKLEIWWAEFQKKAMPDPDRLQIEFMANRRVATKGGDADDRMQEYSPEIHIDNRSASIPVRNAKVSMLVFGKSVLNSSIIGLIWREDFDLALLEAGHQTTLRAQPFHNSYDRDGAAFGFMYSGYAVLLYDADGQLATHSVTPVWLEKHTGKMEKLKKNKTYTRNLDPL